MKSEREPCSCSLPNTTPPLLDKTLAAVEQHADEPALDDRRQSKERRKRGRGLGIYAI